jgi:hypothetical protein
MSKGDIDAMVTCHADPGIGARRQAKMMNFRSANITFWRVGQN